MQFKNLDQNALSSSELAVQAQAVLDADNYAEMSAFAADILGATGIKPVGTPKSKVKSALSIFIDKYLDANVDISGDDTNTVSPSAGAESDNSPQPTGKGGGNGEFYYWPLTGDYAAMQNGKPCDPKFDKEMWDVVSLALPDFTDLKPAVIKAAKKAAEPTFHKYTVTVNLALPLTFDSTDPDLQATDLTLETLNNLLADLGQRTVKPVFALVKGKVKKSGSRSTAGEGSGFYTATQRSELKELNVVQKQVLQAAASIDGCPLSDYAKYGRQDSVKLGNICIEFKKKGYGDAIRRQNGAIFFDPGAMYDGYTLADSGI